MTNIHLNSQFILKMPPQYRHHFDSNLYFNDLKFTLCEKIFLQALVNRGMEVRYLRKGKTQAGCTISFKCPRPCERYFNACFKIYQYQQGAKGDALITQVGDLGRN
jgi:hypothetical protein